MAAERVLGGDLAHDVAHELVGFVLDGVEASTRLVLLGDAAVGSGPRPRLELLGLKRGPRAGEVAGAVLMGEPAPKRNLLSPT